MNFKVIGLAAVLAFAGISASNAQENNFPQPDGDVVCPSPGPCNVTQDWELSYCTENSCLWRVCTTITGAGTNCGFTWRPKPPIDGPGYPEEP